MPSLHYPVLLEPVLRVAFPLWEGPKRVIDATLGLGGHSLEIIQRLPPGSTWIGIDRDSENLSKAKEYLLPHLEKMSGVQYYFIHSSFSELPSICKNLQITEIDFILYDLGVSSIHLDEGLR